MFENPFFGNTEYNHIRLFLILYCTALGVQILFNFRDQWRFLRTQPPDSKPSRILGKCRPPKLRVPTFICVGIFLCANLFLSCFGLYPQVFLSFALVSYFLYFGQIGQLAYIRRKTNIIPFVLVLLAVSPAVSSPLNRAAPMWPLFLVKAVIASVYFSSGYQKLRRVGWRWADGKSLRAHLIQHHLWGDMKAALMLAKKLWLCRLLSGITLTFELTFWVILFIPNLTYLYVPVGIGFHLGTGLAMRIHYLKYFGLVYLVFATDFCFWLLGRMGWITP